MNRRNLELLIEFTKRDFFLLYRNSWLGAAWILINPLILIGVYTLLFSQILGVRFHAGASHLDYAVALAARLAVFSYFSQTLTEAPGRIQAHAYFVKKIIFPVGVAAAAKTLVDAAQLMVSLLLAVLIYLLFGGNVFFSSLLFALGGLASTMMFCLGLALGLSALGVYVPDLSQALAHVSRILIYISPVFFPLSLVPERFHPWMYLSPATWMIELTCRPLMEGAPGDVLSLALFSLISAGTLVLGYQLFKKLRPGFSDVL